VRDEMGNFRILEDNVRIPSGVSYVIENRRAMTQTSRHCSRITVHPVDSYPAHLFAALRAAAPPNVTDRSSSCSVRCHNAAYFEHVLLARMMGAELVEVVTALPVQSRLYANDERRTTGARDLSPRRRRLARSLAVPTGLDHRRRRTGELRARRELVISNGIGNASPTTNSSTPTSGVHPLLFERRAAD